MKLTIFYGEDVDSYMCRGWEDDDPKKQEEEWAPRNHQICLSNEFASGWRDINSGKGTWYMGCIWIKGLTSLTRKQLQDILKNAPDALGKFVYGTTLENSIQMIEKKMDRLTIYIVANSPIVLNEVKWEYNDLPLVKQRLMTILNGETHHMQQLPISDNGDANMRGQSKK